MSKDYIVHKAVEFEDCNKAYKQRYGSVDNVAKSYIAQPKHDGCNTLFFFDGKEGQARSRTAEAVPQFDDLHQWFRRNKFPKGVYLGEAWHPNLPFRLISGTFRRQYLAQGADRLRLVVFDYLTHEEFTEGRSLVPYEERTERMGSFLNVPYVVDDAPAYPIQGFGVLQDTWPKATPQDIANKLVATGGYDGLILRQRDGFWRKGDNGKYGEIIKVKPNLELSLEVVGTLTSLGEKTGRNVYRIEVRMPDGSTQVVGSGVPHEFSDVPRPGTIVEIWAMGYTESGALREPRYKGVRSDVVL